VCKEGKEVSVHERHVAGTAQQLRVALHCTPRARRLEHSTRAGRHASKHASAEHAPGCVLDRPHAAAAGCSSTGSGQSKPAWCVCRRLLCFCKCMCLQMQQQAYMVL
jgi:hypothetical protein